MSEKQLSIVIPVYNVELYLEKCLNSVLEQLNSSIEIILVNDGSKDDSLEICKKYQRLYSDIKLINQENAGLSAARNTGIRNSCGEYILFLDSDDFLSENCLMDLLELLNDKKDFIIGKAKYFDEITQREKSTEISYITSDDISPSEWLWQMNRKSNFWFAAWLLVVRRDFIINNKLFFKEGIYHEDELWVPLVFVNARSMGVCSIEFYCYRVNREGSIINSTNIKKEWDKLTIIDEFNKQKELSTEQKKLIGARKAALLYGIIRNVNSFKKFEEYNELKKGILERLRVLNYGKYKMILWLTEIIGIEKVCSLLNK